ncbi:DUF4351 domain-containing protein [Allocoleopsis sp.]|uniref:DUF4351 domain-containing protein n=1 Tax=Allocoleopsis sp. TaxID=3088169 RepID=UPI002FD7764F
MGEVEPELQQQIQALAIAQIEDLGEALLDFSTKGDLEAWLEDCASRLESSNDSSDSE